MSRLLKDHEVAARIGKSKQWLEQARYRERGNLNAGRPCEDLLPRWVDVPGAKRPRVLGTPEHEVEAWIARHTVGQAGAA